MRESNWTEEQLQYLIKNWHKMPNTQIGNAIGKTESAVRNKADKIITFEMMRGRRWSDYEDELLRKLYGTMSIADLSERMKRTTSAIEGRMRSLEGTANGALLQAFYTTQNVAGFLGVTLPAVKRRINKTDIPFFKINVNHFIKEEDFWEWLKDNLEQANYKTITEEYELLAPEWYRKIIKQKKRELRNNNSHKEWDSKEDALLWAEMLKGTSYKQIAVILNRSYCSVRHRVSYLSKKKMSKTA